MISSADVIKQLSGQFKSAEPVLFTGAGFSQDSVGVFSKRNIPSSGDLKQSLWQLAYPKEPFFPGSSLGDVYAVALNKDKVRLRKLLEHRLTVDSATLPDFYRFYFDLPWWRCYTLNVDDLADAAKRRFTLQRPPFAVSTVRRERAGERPPRFHMDVIHLNGLLPDPPEILTFSETQYAQRIARQEPWYARCAAELMSRPVVFVGTELRESPLWQHIELRRKSDGYVADFRPPSILVTPQLDRAREAVLNSLNVQWYQGTARTFADDVLSHLMLDARKGFEFLGSYGDGATKRSPSLVSQLISHEDSSVDGEYLLGAEPRWSDILNGRAVLRSHYSDLEQQILSTLADSSSHTAIAVTGTAGCGKTSALGLIRSRGRIESVESAVVGQRS